MSLFDKLEYFLLSIRKRTSLRCPKKLENPTTKQELFAQSVSSLSSMEYLNYDLINYFILSKMNEDCLTELIQLSNQIKTLQSEYVMSQTVTKDTDISSPESNLQNLKDTYNSFESSIELLVTTDYFLKADCEQFCSLLLSYIIKEPYMYDYKREFITLGKIEKEISERKKVIQSLRKQIKANRRQFLQLSKTI